MSERWVSGSQLKRALVCPASTVLRRSKKQYSANATKASNFGTLAHEYVEIGKIHPETEEWCSRFDRRNYYPHKGWHEVIGWYNPETGEYGLKPPGAEYRKHRDYDFLPDCCIVGTIDFLCPLKDGRWWVDDLKTGAGMFCPKPDSAQMWLAATIVGKVFGTDVLSTITHIPHYPKGTPPDRKRRDFNAKNFDTFESRLDKLYEQYVGQKARLEVGESLTYIKNDECKFCPSRFFCPIGQTIENARR